MFDQISDKVSPHNSFCAMPLKKYVDVTQIRFLIGRFHHLAQALLADVAKRSNILSQGKMLGKILIDMKHGKPFKYKVDRGG